MKTFNVLIAFALGLSVAVPGFADIDRPDSPLEHQEEILKDLTSLEAGTPANQKKFSVEELYRANRARRIDAEEKAQLTSDPEERVRLESKREMYESFENYFRASLEKSAGEPVDDLDHRLPTQSETH